MIEDFLDDNLFKSLDLGSLFRRALPFNSDLQDPDIAHVFRSVLAAGAVQHSSFESDQHCQALETCYQKGWLHTDKLPDESVAYFFTTPLHQWFVEHQLGTRFSNVQIQETSLFDFILKVIGGYLPRQLLTPGIGASFLERTSAAQYQDEFYRSFHALTGGSLISFPEFGIGSGRIDFYIPSKNWGVELTRDGQKLNEHSSRFLVNGTYTPILTVKDHIILDFRKSIPSKSHPGECLKRFYSMALTDLLHLI